MKPTLILAVTFLLLAASAPGLASVDMSASMSGHDGSDASTSTGAWPTLDDALHTLDRHGPIQITDRAGFKAANGVRGGNGTPEDPYVLADIYAPSLVIRNVSAAITIRHVYVSGALVLDWTGPDARVQESYLGALRTNENRPHSTPATWGVFQANRIGDVVVRHQGGAILGNDIGPTGAVDGDRLALEVQGYNGLRVANNTVRGPAEFRLHGHHYASSYEDAWMPMDMMGGNAENRYNALAIEDNRFLDATGRGVAISDRAHAGNDRTATSEPDPALNGTHRHFTRIAFDRNEIRGAGLVIENAAALDPHHEAGGETNITIRGLTVVDPLDGIGLAVRGSHGANITIENGALLMHGEVKGSIGVLLSHVDGGRVTMRDTMIHGFETGLRGEHVGRTTVVTLENVSIMDAKHEVAWDKASPAPTASGSAAGGAS